MITMTKKLKLRWSMSDPIIARHYDHEVGINRCSDTIESYIIHIDKIWYETNPNTGELFYTKIDAQLFAEMMLEIKLRQALEVFS